MSPRPGCASSSALPDGVSSGFVTGAQGANTTALAAARQHVLARAGWDRRARRPERSAADPRPRRRRASRDDRPLAAPARARDRVGRARCRRRPGPDARGRAPRRLSGAPPGRRSSALRQATSTPERSTRSTAIADACEGAGAWLHVDGAFGLWAAASPRFEHLVAGVERADSWATDAHKWLNVPYDCGVVFCRASGRARRRDGGPRELSPARRTAASPSDWVPESSRRARGFAVWAALRALGRNGVAELVERCCDHARTFASSCSARSPSVEILNDVVLNQVLVRFGDDDEATQRGCPPRPGRRHLLARRHRLAGPRGDADLGLELPDDGGRRRASARRRSWTRSRTSSGEPIEERWAPSG